MDWWGLVGFVLHWGVIAGFSLRILVRRMAVGSSLGWLTVIASLPLIGAVLYVLFGEIRLAKKRTAGLTENLKRAQIWLDQWDGPSVAASATLGVSDAKLDRQVETILGYPAICGHKVELLDHFEAIFDRIIQDINLANKTCRLEFYIWHEGGKFEEVIDALIDAAGRGVEIQALADEIGSGPFLRGKSADRLRQAGIQLRASLPGNLGWSFFVRRDLRNHRKIVVIDGEIAYTGSQNLVDPRYFKKDSGVGEWIDAVMRLTGPGAAILEGVFEQDFTLEGPEEANLPDLQPLSKIGEGAIIQVVPSGPGMKDGAIDELLLTAVYGARERLILTSPYFVPSDGLITALRSAAQRGVDVILIVPAKNDSLLARHAGEAHYEELLTAGVRIERFSGGLLHTKSITIDGSTSIFGSVNLDLRSFHLNFEISLFIYDQRITADLETLQNDYLKSSTRLAREDWAGRPYYKRLLEGLFRLVSPLL